MGRRNDEFFRTSEVASSSESKKDFFKALKDADSIIKLPAQSLGTFFWKWKNEEGKTVEEICLDKMKAGVKIQILLVHPNIIKLGGEEEVEKEKANKAERLGLSSQPTHQPSKSPPIARLYPGSA